MNTLIITLGNSEIQFNEQEIGPFEIKSEQNRFILTHSEKDIKLAVRRNVRHTLGGYWLPVSSRESGMFINNNYNDFEEVLRFPIVESLVEFCKTEQIEKIVFVVTDQNDEHHKKGDTLYYAPIIEKYFIGLGLNIIEYNTYTVREGLKDVDAQYTQMGQALDQILQDSSENGVIHLFAQGGIDQINHALTLQLLQRYKERVHIHQKAEGVELREVDFPQLFLSDLTRQQVIKHLSDLDFDKAASLMLNKQDYQSKARTAAMRLALLHDRIEAAEFTEWWGALNGVSQKHEILKDLVYAFRIDFLQKRYNDGLTKLYTVYENLFKSAVDKVVKQDTSEFYNRKNRKPEDENQAWVCFLKKQFSDTIIYRLKKRKKGIQLHNPNVMTYFYLLRFMIEDGCFTQCSDKEIKLLDGIMNDLRQLRNDINHSLGSADESIITERLGKRSIEDMDGIIDKICGTKGLKPYEELSKYLIHEL